MKQKNSRCLLLNADFTPLSIIPWKRAVIWHVKYENNLSYGIDIIDFYKNDYIVGTNNRKYPIPSVVRTKKFFKPYKQQLTFSRKNIFIRDNYTCQYCGHEYLANQLTYDHVIPKSKWDYNTGSPTNWTNIVTACNNCNRKKGNKTPEQANMQLINYPRAPRKDFKYLHVSHLLSKIIHIPEEWRLYLPQSYQNK